MPGLVQEVRAWLRAKRPGGLAAAWPRRVRLLVRSVSLATILGILLAPSSGAAFTTTTITIDGYFDDWIGVRANPANVVRDTQIPDDPDWPGQPDRDVYIVGTTYDNEYLYFSWRRTAGGTKAITFGAYLDYQGDGLLQNDDKVVVWTVSTGKPYASYQNGNAMILHYNQARSSGGALYHPEGDPMRDTHRTGMPSGDGETPDGWAQWQDGYDVPAKTMDGHLSPSGDGIECEARVAWSDLGVAPGHPFAIHFAAGNGPAWGTRNKPSVTYKAIGGGRFLEEDRGQVEDNIEPIMYLLNRGVSVSPDNAGGGSAGTTVSYTHTITNTGNGTETFDLAALSGRGWSVTITDSGGNPVSSVTLVPGSAAGVLVHVTVPPGTADGTLDVTTLTATSQTDPGVRASVTDTTRVGQVTVTPNQGGTMAPGQTIGYEFTVQNNTASSGVFDLSTTSSLGWPRTMVDANGNPLTSMPLGPGESRVVTVRVAVPAGTPNGTQDVTHLAATLQGSPSVASSASAVTTVRDGLAMVAGQTGYGGVGTWVQYTHTVTNSWPEARSIALTASSTPGWTPAIFAADGVTPISSVTLGPNGASAEIVVRVLIPSGAGTDDQGTMTVTASAGGQSASVTDTTIVRQLTTYADSGYVNQSDSFVLGDVVFARATGLQSGSVYFVWKDANGTTVRTSSLRTVDTQGAAFDEYGTLDAEPVGDWAVEVYRSGGTLIERNPFTVTYDAEISVLSATDAPGVGQEIAVTSSVANRNTSTIANSTMTYVIWWDGNGNGVLGAGDTYIDTTGAPVVWDGVAAIVPTHTTTGITIGGGGTWSEPTPWTVSNAQFPNQGTYRVTATWITASGRLIDSAVTELYSIPALGWPLFGLTVIGAATTMWRRRRSHGQPPEGGSR